MTFDTPALYRLEHETLGWLATAYPDGRIAASLVWFLWRDGELVVYSRDNRKVRNIEAHPQVSFNLNSDEWGGGVLTIEGTALVDRSYPASNAIPEYTAKYAELIERLGTTSEGFAADYSVPVRIMPTSYRAW
ncbi:MAG: TIGR03667 family PPOX class F420-dependent oxidoreductase [bacterium]|nr:TIGR03667 family PPOX class F420-dependent oxidoreductase [bacterium]